MTLAEFKGLKKCEGCRVHKTFTDGQEMIATLVDVTIDLDESRHLIDDQIEFRFGCQRNLAFEQRRRLDHDVL